MKKIKAISLILTIVLALLSPQVSQAANSQEFEDDLATYLSEVSSIRGFQITREDIEIALLSYDESLENFESVDELDELLGEVINSNLSNLDLLYETYDLDDESLTQLLTENGEDISDYVYVEELEFAVSFYLEDPDAMDEEMLLELVDVFQQEFDLTNEEVERFKKHIRSLEEKLSQPDTLQQLENIAARMASFSEFTEADDLTEDQIAELIAVYKEMASIFEVETKFALVKNGVETPLSIKELMKMDELINTNLKMEIYDKNGDFLGDLIITGETVDSDTVVDTGKKVEKITKKITKQSPAQKQMNKTVKGGELPNTASNMGMNIVMGLVLFLTGSFMYRRMKA